MGTKQQRVRPGWRSAVYAVMTLLLVGLSLLNNAAGAQTQTAANAVTTFNVHSSAGVQAEPAITVILRDGNGPEYEVRLPELLIQMVREANRGTFVLMPALGHVILVPMPEFAVLSRDLPVLAEINREDHRALDIMPAG
ncbi:MAG TPA: hypothetical protein DFJ59_06150, partial [Alphaproteobacteria bacterium]|nr:hypothetical protein [Alphaproteobacteria bacterium]